MISPLFKQIQRWERCQKKQKTFGYMNLLMVCAKIWVHFNKVKKNTKKTGIFFAQFQHFCRFFNSSRILAQKTAKLTFLTLFRFYWHPCDPPICRGKYSCTGILIFPGWEWKIYYSSWNTFQERHVWMTLRF